MEKKELDCVVSPVESYEDVTNIPLGDSHNQEEDPISFSGNGLSEEELSVSGVEVDIQTPDSVPQPDVTLVSWIESPVNTQVTTELSEDGCSANSGALHLSYDKIKNYRLFHFVISKHEIRQLLVNIEEKVDDVVLKVCATFGIDRAEEYSLWLPKGVPLVHETRNNVQKFNIGSLTNIFKTLKSVEAEEAKCEVLDGNKSLHEQFTFNVKPYIVHLSKHSPLEEVDLSEDVTDFGEEWPSFEEVEIARQREFNQCWCGIVQGDYPIEMEVATKLAALLLRVYFRDKQPPDVYSPSIVQQFLPEMFASNPEAPMQVKQFYEALEGTTQSEAIDQVIQTCRQTVTYGGLFFPVQEVEVPGQFLSWKKSKRYIFGVNHQGVIKLDTFTGKVLSVKRFTDIHSGRCRENVLHLSFRHWDLDFYAKTEQATEILEVLRIYIDVAKRTQVAHKC